MVAKSFQNMKQTTEPYKLNGRMYVKVLNEKTGTERQVRWYTDAEYAKMYNEPVEEKPSGLNMRTQKKALGFEKGYITIFKGDTYANLEWFQKSIARYCKLWGWYIISTEAIPCDLPCGLEPIELKWEYVGEEEGMLKPDAVVTAYVNSLLYDAGVSEFQGNIGDRLDLELTVIAAHKGENQYGSYTIHYMEDAVGNQYLWNTGAKSWEVGDKRHIKGTVKDHKVFKNVNTTILTRCTLVK
jgi:hypothetical protein